MVYLAHCAVGGIVFTPDSNMLRPIVFIHRGCPDYLKITLAKARQYNPDAPLILLGDSSNAHLVREIPGLEFDQMQLDTGDSARFAKIYQHQSFLSEEFERFCMQRWILLRDLVRQRKWDRLLHLDSDVLLYSNIEQTGKRFDDYVMSLAPWGHRELCGHTCFINQPEILDEFVNYLFELYTTEEGKRQREPGTPSEKKHWISDMSCLGFFRDKTSHPIADLTQIIENAVFDDFITSTCGNYEKRSRFWKRDLKRVYFKDSIPYCRLKEKGTPSESIRFLSLHFHGGTKWMIKYFAKEYLDAFAMFYERVGILFRQSLRGVGIR